MVPSCVEHLPCVGPAKWVREVAIPTCGKASDRVRELPSAVEREMAEALCRQNPEPDLDLVQPAAVARGKHEREARIGRQPVARRLTPSGINVVGDDDHGPAGIPVSEQVEKREHVGHLPVLRHLYDHAASPNVERCEDVARADDTRTRPGPGGRDAAARRDRAWTPGLSSTQRTVVPRGGWTYNWHARWTLASRYSEK